MDGDQGSTRNVIEKLRKDIESKNFEAGKFSTKFAELERKLTEIVEPNRRFAIETNSRKASKLAELKAALDAKIGSRNEEMDHVAHLLATLKLQRENKRQDDVQKHKRKLALIKRKTEVYRRVATLVRVANKLKTGKSLDEATADLKAEVEKKREKLKAMKETLAKKNAAIDELRQRKSELEAKLVGPSAEESKKTVEGMRLQIIRLDELQNQLQDEADYLDDNSGRIEERQVHLQNNSKYMDGGCGNFIDDSGYNEDF